MKPQVDLKFHAGYSESVWKSLVVKALRIGWPNGLLAASRHLTPSTMRSLLMCGIFEDTFPARVELSAAVRDVRDLNFNALCARETHHGRGHTQRFYDVRDEAVAASRSEQGRLYSIANELGIKAMPPRALNCFWTWLAIHPDDEGRRRTLDLTPWNGMPACMIDGHTLEGKRIGQKTTVLSGSYSQHLAISKMVEEGGWEAVRSQVHSHRT